MGLEGFGAAQDSGRKRAAGCQPWFSLCQNPQKGREKSKKEKKNPTEQFLIALESFQAVLPSPGYKSGTRLTSKSRDPSVQPTECFSSCRKGGEEIRISASGSCFSLRSLLIPPPLLPILPGKKTQFQSVITKHRFKVQSCKNEAEILFAKQKKKKRRGAYLD